MYRAGVSGAGVSGGRIGHRNKVRHFIKFHAMGNCQSDHCESEEDGVKKSNLEPGSLQLGSIYTWSELISAANDHCHLHRKACHVYRNQKELTHLVCVHQFMAMKLINKSNALARKSFVPISEDDKYRKEEYPLLCRGHIKAHPLKKSKKKMRLLETRCTPMRLWS
eukprot:scaffold87567_cov43-Attheya_sp.AAC.6